MPKQEKEQKSVLAEARAWAIRRKLFGAQAFLRYVILRFTENLNQVSDDFVFKGGNLLWVYINTPRATIDLDLATLKTVSHKSVREVLERSCEQDVVIQYVLLSFKEVEHDGKSGAAATIGYTTEQGAKNRFEVDIVYAIDTDSRKINSPIHASVKIRSATLENIIADKLAACQRFRSGNTRMQDFDDLWRLAGSKSEVNVATLAKLLKRKDIAGRLDGAWINPELELAWRAHQDRYNDLPEKLGTVFETVNAWLVRVF